MPIISKRCGWAFLGGAGDGSVQLFTVGEEVGSLHLLTTMAEHEHLVSCVRVDRSSLCLASASWDGG